ncbi:hypothetical protein KCP76_04245 [Salmonella enterica subsp. enterica serovar Weltevreden]|nr:hypothetical protein KCP76_04245 [Salmonella enterica subsp. enterica serovar Weltevreden]
MSTRDLVAEWRKAPRCVIVKAPATAGRAEQYAIGRRSFKSEEDGWSGVIYETAVTAREKPVPARANPMCRRYRV